MKDHHSGDIVYNWFCLFLERDENLLQQLNNFGQGITVDANEWLFTVPALYDFACNSSPQFKQMDYPKFRNMLFQYPFNQKLKGTGAEISISQNYNKLDLSIYRLGPVSIP
ncbi:hypothetical protein [Kiloniella sp.]|uniref:hypothetical protein n=1 Tax=Kiloniella sp. TaxID=1938587 RepID=UPI003B0184BA